MEVSIFKLFTKGGSLRRRPSPAGRRRPPGEPERGGAAGRVPLPGDALRDRSLGAGGLPVHPGRADVERARAGPRLADGRSLLRAGARPRSAEWFTYIVNKITADEIAGIVKGELVGHNITVDSVATYSSNQKNSLSYIVGDIEDPKEPNRIVLCDRNAVDHLSVASKIIVSSPRESFLLLLSNIKPDYFRTTRIQFEKLGFKGGKSSVHKTAYAEHGVIIGAGCVIEPHAVIKSGTIIGHNIYISSNSVLGTHGPAVYRTNGKKISYIKLHYETLQISEEVEIGNSCVLLRGMLGRTYIGSETILGNLVHIGHGTEIRERVWMAAGVTVCGHGYIDSGVTIGAGSVIRDNVTIGSHASIGMGSVVVNDVQANARVMGVPAKEKHTGMKSGPRL